MKRLIRACLLSAAALASLVPTSHAQVPCLSGHITATPVKDGPYRGWHRYCLTFIWNQPGGIEHLSLGAYFGKECQANQCQLPWGFANPEFDAIRRFRTASSPACKPMFVGEFACAGDPSAAMSGPALRWNAVFPEGCSSPDIGIGEVCFYSPFAPSPEPGAPLGVVVNGNTHCQAYVYGDIPNPCSSSPTVTRSWGGLKQIYR